MSPQSPVPSNQIPPISLQEKANYAQLFNRSAPNGTLEGGAARDIFLKLGLPNETLIHIWNLVDTQRRGKLELKEFVLALHLIRSITKGTLQQLPSSIPPDLLDSFNDLARSSSVSSNSSTRYSQRPAPRQPVAAPISQAAGKSTDWTIPPLDKAKFDSYFENLDKSKAGVIGAAEVVPFLMTSNLSEEVLAQIWDLADTHHSGKFTKIEFAIAMFLVQQKLQGRELPTTLPSLLLSSVSNSTQQQHQRVGSTSSTPAPPSSINDLLSLGNALASPTPTTPTTSFPEPAASNVRPFVPTSQFGQIISKEKSDGSSEVPNTSDLPAVVSHVTSPSSNRLSTPPVASSAPASAPANAPASLPPVPAHSFGTASSSSSVPFAIAAHTAPAAPASRSILAAPAAVGAAAGLAGSAVVGAISSFGSHNHQSNSALSDIDNQIKDVNGQVTSISNNNSQLSGQVDAISAQLAQSNEKLEYAQSELKRVSALKETLQAKLASTQAEFETDSKKLSDVQETLQQIQNEFDSLSANYTELQSSHESLKGQIVDAATKLEQEKQQNAELDEQIDDIQTELQTLEGQFETFDKDTRQQSGLLAINKKKFTGLEAQKEELTAKIAELQNELETTNTQLLEVEGTHTSLNTETEELKSKVETATAEIDNLKGQVESTSKEVENLKVEIENSKAKFNSLEQEKSSLHEELVKLQADKEESLKELARINEKTQLLTSDIAKLQKERETTKKQLIANETARSEANANLEKLESKKTLASAAPVIVGKEALSSTASKIELSQPVSRSINEPIELVSDKGASASVVSKIGETSKVDVSKQVTGENPILKSVDIDTDNAFANSTNFKAEEPSSNFGSNSAGRGAGIAAAAIGASAVIGSVLFSKANEETEKVKPIEITPAVEESISPAVKDLDSNDIKEDIPIDAKSVEPLTGKKLFSFGTEEYQSDVLDSSISIAPSESVSNESITSDSNIQEPVTTDASIRSLVAEPINTSIRDDLAEDVYQKEKKDEVSLSSSVYGIDYNKDQNSLSLPASEAATKFVAEPPSLIESVHSAESYDIIDKNEIPSISKFSEPASVNESESVTEESEPFTIPGSMPAPVIAIESNSAITGKSTPNDVSDGEDAESQYSDAIEPFEEASSSKYESRLKDSAINGDSSTIDTSATTDLAPPTSESNVKAATKPVVESEPSSKISESEITTPPIDVEKIPIASAPVDVPTLAPTTEPVSLDIGEFTPVAAHSDSTISLHGFKADTTNMDSFNAASLPTGGSVAQENLAIEPQNVVFPTGHDILSARDEFDKAFESLNNDSANVWPTTSVNASGFDDFDKAFSAESGFSRADEEDEETHGTVPFVQTAPVAEHNTGSDLSYTTTPVFAQAPSGQFSISQVETEAPRNFSIEANSPFAPAQPAEIPSTHPFFVQRGYNDESLPAFLRNKNDIDPFDAAFDGLMAAEEEKDGDFDNGHAGPAHSSTPFPPVASSLGTFPNDNNVQHAGTGPAPTVSNSEWDSIFAGFTNENTENTSGNTDDAFSPAVPSLDKPFGGVLKHLEDEYSHLDQKTQQKLQNLTSMGFDKTRALEALEKNNFNIEDASNFLLDQ